MKVSDIIRIGDKIDIRVLQEVEQAEKITFASGHTFVL